MRSKQIYFDESFYDFVRIIRELFGVKELEYLHKSINEEYKEQFKVGKDSSTVFHTKFYDKYRSGWGELQSLYDLFIKNVIAPRQEEDFLYQKFPTFRVHLPGNVAVGAFHKDAEFNHPKGELNFIIPLTNSDGTASVWVESEPDKKDFEPLEMVVGTLIQFNGNELTHGNKINETDKTRVSMDFRILPISKYHPESSQESVTRKTKFIEGEYYSRFMQPEPVSKYTKAYTKEETVEEIINALIKRGNVDTNKISDGYHTFGQLYDHRITLFILVAKREQKYQVWRSKKHSDGSEWSGWFLLGIGKDKGYQITYHLPIDKWDECGFAETLDVAPEFDGHTSDDVLHRLRLLPA